LTLANKDWSICILAVVDAFLSQLAPEDLVSLAVPNNSEDKRKEAERMHQVLLQQFEESPFENTNPLVKYNVSKLNGQVQITPEIIIDSHVSSFSYDKSDFYVFPAQYYQLLKQRDLGLGRKLNFVFNKKYVLLPLAKRGLAIITCPAACDTRNQNAKTRFCRVFTICLTPDTACWIGSKAIKFLTWIHVSCRGSPSHFDVSRIKQQEIPVSRQTTDLSEFIAYHVGLFLLEPFLKFNNKTHSDTWCKALNAQEAKENLLKMKQQALKIDYNVKKRKKKQLSNSQTKRRRSSSSCSERIDDGENATDSEDDLNSINSNL
jgi:hypothetical protein